MLLINPGYSSTYGLRRWFSSFTPPLGLGYLTSALRNCGHRVIISDLEAQQDFDVRRFLRENNVQVVGITGTTATADKLLKIAALCKQEPGTKVLCGGPHASVRYADLLGTHLVDYVVLGEGDVTLSDLVNRLNHDEDPRTTPGIAYLNDNAAIKSEPRVLVQNLDELPFPASDLYGLRRYRPGFNRMLPMPVAPMITGRGCPFQCSYCATKVTFGTKVRLRSTTNVIAEIRHLKTRFGIRGIIFWDDVFTIDQDRANELCALIQKEQIAWVCNTRADLVSSALLRRMREAGCRLVFYGAESFNQATLNRLGRHLLVEHVFRAVIATRKAGMLASVSIIIGLPWENQADIEANLRTLIKLAPDYATVNIFAPHPGTPLFEECARRDSVIANVEGWLDNKAYWSEPTGHPVANVYLSRRQLQSLKRRGLLRFYLRPLQLFWQAKRLVLRSGIMSRW